MRLDLKGIKDRKSWEEKGYRLPAYEIEAMRKATAERPYWVHFGAGNLFRAFHANIAQRMLDQGILNRGVIVAEGFDSEIIHNMYEPCDNLGIVVTLRADGTMEKTVTASVAEAVAMDEKESGSFDRLREIFQKESLQMATFTITEKGYSLTGKDGGLLPDAAADFAAGPGHPVSYMGKVTSLLYARFQAGSLPLAMVSTDNCSHNGDKLFAAVRAFADAWVKNGKAETGFLTYVESERVSFPWTMIDKITPRPDQKVEEELCRDGVEELSPVVTSKQTYVAPFVNAEETEYLVVEDDFPNGRPALEKGGVLFAGRETVEQAERMKVCTCLNPLHTALAVFGCLLGYEKISDEMQDEEPKKLAERIGRDEGLPVVTDPGILNPEEFLETVLKVRLPNPFLPDTPQRIATDTSQKLAIRFGETIKAYIASQRLQVKDLRMIPLVFAGWLRYLMAVDDRGEPFALSPDPRKEELCPYVAGFDLKTGVDTAAAKEALLPVLRDETIFGVDLWDAGLAETVVSYFSELAAGPGAVRATLRKYIH